MEGNFRETCFPGKRTSTTSAFSVRFIFGNSFGIEATENKTPRISAFIVDVRHSVLVVSHVSVFLERVPFKYWRLIRILFRYMHAVYSYWRRDFIRGHAYNGENTLCAVTRSMAHRLGLAVH